MHYQLVRLACCCLAVLLTTSVASADTLFMQALKEKYGFQGVKCDTCHAKGVNPANGRPFGKDVRNDFGKLFEPSLKAKNMAVRLKQSKQAQPPQKAQLQAAITVDFLEALTAVEAMKAADGKAYADKLKAGEVDGVTLKQR